MENKIDTQLLHRWFDENRRAFPWRKKPTPYRVWISEVMLQQTRASVVIPYFERWMQRFPDLQTLAKAPLEEVIKAWEGLGYYSRARNLHEGAKQVIEQFAGEIPATQEGLEKIKGLGPYTINAILSFAFHKRAAAVDGNVARVLSRHFLIEEDLRRSAAKRKLQALADAALDKKLPWKSAEALIELGATLCLPKPLCGICPLASNCLAQKEGKAEQLPINSKEAQLTLLTRSVAVIEEGGALLLRKGAPGKLMADLYEFPWFEGLETPLARYLRTLWGLKTSFIRSLPFVQHSFTRYNARLFPIHLRAEERLEIDDFEWVHLDQASKLPFSSGHRKILQDFLERSDVQLRLFV